MKTIKPTIKVIVAVVAAVLVAMLIAGIVVGILYYINSNEYRFRMSAFEGEYENEKLKQYGVSFDFSIVEQTRNGGEFVMGASALVVDGKTRYVQDYYFGKYDESKELTKEDFDQSIFEQLEYFSQVFNGNCVVAKDYIEFKGNGTRMELNKNTYYSRGFASLNPYREIYYTDEQFGWKVWCVFHSAYILKENGLIRTVNCPTFFVCYLTSPEIVAKDGKTYTIGVDFGTQNIYYKIEG